MLILLLGAGIYLTIRLRFVQLRRFGLSFRLLLGNRDFGESAKERKGDISPFQALAASLAAVIGNGNIAGVCTAIAMGGPGAVFWMWLAAFFGMATKVAEAVLGQKFKITAPDGTIKGGPMYYISHGLGLPWLAGIFAFFMGCKPLFSTTSIQSNSVALVLRTQLGIEPWITGIGLAFLTWLVIIGGIKSIARVAEFLSPIMVFLYITGALITIIIFYHKIPDALSLIFVGAFKPTAVTGGVAGMTIRNAIRYGFSRGAYSNEAGTGTEAVFHACIRKNFGCTHMIVGRDHAGVGHYYQSFQAQEIFDQFSPEEIGIKVLKYDHFIYCRLCRDLVGQKACSHSDQDKIFFSGTQIREMIKNKQALPEELIRPEIANLLLNHPNPLIK